MKTQLRGLIVVIGLFITGSALAQDGAAAKKNEKKADGHCEKVENGEHKDIEVKDKAECKKKGGKWQKGAAHTDHKK